MYQDSFKNFCRDFGIPLDEFSLQNCFQKSNDSGRFLSFDQFEKCLINISYKINQQKIIQLKKLAAESEKNVYEKQQEQLYLSPAQSSKQPKSFFQKVDQFL